MHTKICLLAAIALLALRLPALSQSEATAQAEVAFRHADQELNESYAALLARARQRALKDSIRDAQRAWVEFRDKEAALRAAITSAGGSAYTMDYLANRTELTEERVKQLKALREKL